MRVSAISTVFISVMMAATVTACPPGTSAVQQPLGDKASVARDHSAHQVQLPLIVRDKHGAPTTNLTAADITLTDNGRPQQIQILTQGNTVPINLGLLVDTSRGMVRAMDSQRKAADAFINAVLPANSAGKASASQVFLIHFDREVELLQDFTNSRDKLHNGLEQLGPTHTEVNTQGPETTDSEGSRVNLRNASPQLYDAIYLAANDMMKSKHGRKALIVFGNGVDGGSKESLSDAIDAAERVHAPVYTVYFKGDQERAEGAFPGRSGGGWPGSGGGWPGGGGGGYPGGRGGGARLPHTDGRKILQEIATRTGGLYFEAKKTADFAAIYNQIAQNVLGQYLLTYTPDHSGNDANFHKIAVKLSKGNLIATAPEGYYSDQNGSQ